MRISEDIRYVRNEYFELYTLLLKQGMIQEDEISMGNLALFVDYYLHRYKWKEKKEKIKKLAEKKEKNEINLLIAEQIFECAKKLEISDNLYFKMKKIEYAYKTNKLQYFDLVLDTHEFPGWFKSVLEYYPSLSKKDLYTKLLKGLEKYPVSKEKGNQLTLAYFVDKFYGMENQLQMFTDLDYLIEEETLNEVAWFIAFHTFRSYYPELKKSNEVEEKKLALSKLGEYQKLYQKKKLDTFSLFFDKKKSNLIIPF